MRFCVKKESNNICTLENYSCVCPVLDAHDKIEEAYYFLLMMAFNYHKADEFRFNLHAFIKSLREVTFILQNSKDKIPDFDKWYPQKQEEMKNNDILKSICESRTIIVHRAMLKPRSKVSVGLYRGRKLKMAFEIPIDDPFIDSKALFDFYIPKFKEMGFIDKAHSAISEQLGLRRQWYCEQFGDKEIFSTCVSAYMELCQIIYEVHSFFDFEFIPQGIPNDFYERTFVLLESDFDPSLPEKWGWI